MNERYRGIRGWFRAVLARLATDRRGAVSVVIGLSISALVGIAALGSEVGEWYMTKRNMQGAADAAAFTAATDLMAGDTTHFAAQGKGVAAKLGYTDDSNGVSVAVNNPPLTGPYKGNANAVEVIISQPKQPLVAQMFQTQFTINARAVAVLGLAANGCLLAMDPHKSGAITANGSPDVDANCGINVNSDSQTAMILNGNANISSTTVTIVGNYQITGQSTIDASRIIIDGPAATDPYANLNVPSFSGCTDNGGKFNGGGKGVTIPAGVHCGNIDINGGANVTFAPGIHIFDQGSVNVTGNATVSGDGVSMVFTSSTGQNYGTWNDGGTGSTTISAITDSSNTMAGIAFYQDRNTPNTTTASFNGNSSSEISGVTYMPTVDAIYNGTPTSNTQCAQVLANTITFNGNVNMAVSDNCKGVPGVKSFGALPVALVE